MKQKIYVNISPGDMLPVAYFSQFDEIKNGLDIYLIYDGVPYTEATSAVITGVKSDGKAFEYEAVAIDGNKITVDITEQMTAIYGDVICELRLSNGDGTIRTGTLNFVIRVEKSPLEHIIISRNDFVTLKAIHDACFNYQQRSEVSEANAKISETQAEAARIEAEAAAAAAKTSENNAKRSEEAAEASATNARNTLIAVGSTIDNYVENTTKPAIDAYAASYDELPNPKLYAGTGSAANAAATNGNVKLTVTQGTTVKSKVSVIGAGGTTVESTASGQIKIISPALTNKLTSTSTTTALTAAQGKILNDRVVKGTPVEVLTSTLSAGSTEITFTNSLITSSSTFDVFTSVFGMNIKMMALSGNSLTITFTKSRDDSTSVKLHIWA